MGDTSATCHEGRKGVLGTKESTSSTDVSTGSGSDKKAGSTIDVCPLGPNHGVTAGYALLEVHDGGATVPTENGDETETDTVGGIANSSALDETPVERRKLRACLLSK